MKKILLRLGEQGYGFIRLGEAHQYLFLVDDSQGFGEIEVVQGDGHLGPLIVTLDLFLGHSERIDTAATHGFRVVGPTMYQRAEDGRAHDLTRG